MQLTGTIKEIGALQQGESKNGQWQKREFVVNYKEGNFEKHAPFQMMGDKVSSLESLQVGQTVTVDFNIEGRHFNDRWYANLNAWRVG